jgi:hypothetical protein
VDGLLELSLEEVVLGSERDGVRRGSAWILLRSEWSAPSAERQIGRATNESGAHNSTGCDSMLSERSPCGSTLVPGLNLGGGARRSVNGRGEFLVIDGLRQCR